MIDTAKLAAEKNVCLHTHLAETEDENAFCEENVRMQAAGLP